MYIYTRTLRLASVSPATPPHEEKSFELAMTDLIWISTFAGATALAVGVVIYVVAKKQMSEERREQVSMAMEYAPSRYEHTREVIHS